MSMCQLAKKVVSDGLGLVDCAIGLVNFVRNLPSGQMKCFGEFKCQKKCSHSCSSENLFGSVKITLELVHTACKESCV